jgi:hypothetical protein
MERADAVRDCEQLVLRITQHADHGEASAAAALYADGGTLRRAGREISGKDELIDAYSDPPERLVRHINGGTVVTVVDDDRATAVTYYMAYRFDSPSGPAQLPAPLPAPFSLGEWHDEFVRTADGWRFAARSTQRVFVAADR